MAGLRGAWAWKLLSRVELRLADEAADQVSDADAASSRALATRWHTLVEEDTACVARLHGGVGTNTKASLITRRRSAAVEALGLSKRLDGPCGRPGVSLRDDRALAFFGWCSYLQVLAPASLSPLCGLDSLREFSAAAVHDIAQRLLVNAPHLLANLAKFGARMRDGCTLSYEELLSLHLPRLEDTVLCSWLGTLGVLLGNGGDRWQGHNVGVSTRRDLLLVHALLGVEHSARQVGKRGRRDETNETL